MNIRKQIAGLYNIADRITDIELAEELRGKCDELMKIQAQSYDMSLRRYMYRVCEHCANYVDDGDNAGKTCFLTDETVKPDDTCQEWEQAL